MTKITKNIIYIIAISSCIICAQIYRHFSFTSPEEKIIYIPPSSSIREIACILKKDHLIESKLYFTYFSYIRQKFTKKYMMNGEYFIPPNSNIFDIIKILESGKVILHYITFPEGVSNYQVRQILDEEPMLTEEVDIDFQEGLLLPETYQFKKNDTKQSIINHMKKNMKNIIQEEYKNYDGHLTVNEIIILASLIEKETSLIAERALVSSVFYNRLKLNMPLQTDPTIIYALTDGRYNLGRPLYRKDLLYISPYNTYIHKGLPPGPICNPGKSSIQAAIFPVKTDFLYFVAEGSTQGHLFAKSLSEHNKNVLIYRINVNNK